MVQTGQLVAGRYRLKSPIGEGAMASVWRAADETLQREVAIKFLYVRGAREPRALIDQFLREARIAAAVQHRNVIHTVDFGALDDQQPFMVMELLNGESLAERMARKPPLDQQQMVDLMSMTLRGLAAVHDAGIVHRDIKPANIFLQRDADAVYPKILDFGISRSLREGTERPSAIATQDGMIVGTPDYMSPEQARGETDIDKRADIYSMGVILYRGLTGRLPFVAETVGNLLVQILTSTAPSVRELCPTVDPALSAVVEQSMARDRENRFADARAMRRALRGALKRASLQERRASADSYDGVVRGASGAPFAASPAALASPAAAHPAAHPAQAQAGGWGDMDVLGLGHKRDLAPVPVAAAVPMPARATPQNPLPAPSPAENAAAPKPNADPSLELSATPARAAAGGTRPAKAAAAAAGASMPDMLNPLYQGKDLPALDIDYARVRSDRGTHDRPLTPDATPRPARPQAKARPTAKVPARETPTPQPAPRPKAKSGATLWLLALAALALAAYILARPGADDAPSEIRPTGPDARPLVKNRRANLKDVPPHLRDVRF